MKTGNCVVRKHTYQLSEAAQVGLVLYHFAQTMFPATQDHWAGLDNAVRNIFREIRLAKDKTRQRRPPPYPANNYLRFLVKNLASLQSSSWPNSQVDTATTLRALADLTC